MVGEVVHCNFSHHSALLYVVCDGGLPHSALLHVIWKGGSPHGQMLPLGKEDTTYSGSGDVDSTNHSHLVRYACSLCVAVDCGGVVVEGG